jgi:DNA-binding beta-propeller fold protein YncE
MMPNHNTESDADLTKLEADGPDGTVSGPGGIPDDSTTEVQPSPPEPTGGEPAAGGADASATESAGEALGIPETETAEQVSVEADGDEAAAAGEAGEAGGTTAGAEASSSEGAEEGLAVAAGAAAGLEAGDAAALAQQKKRRRLVIGLVALAVLVIAAGALFVRYLLKPGPLPDLLPLPVDVTYRPHYLFSIYGVDKPVGVAVSPDGGRIYATESGGQREVKVFDRDGNPLAAFSPPHTAPTERSPVYVAVDPTGRVYVTDRLQRAVFVYDSHGKLVDAILAPDLTLSEYVYEHVDELPPDGTMSYNLFGHTVRFQIYAGEQLLPAPALAAWWAPLGIRIDELGTVFLTDVPEGQHTVRELPGELMLETSWREFDPPEIVFGAQGQGSGEFMYPNSAVIDSTGRIYVTDGNNGRVSVWDGLGSFLFNFAHGVGESALSLPRGAAMDGRDRLHVVDAVQQSVKVYDVSGEEPSFLFAFGDWGTKNGEFNYPVDIALDGTGRLYIADRENNRIQVWSY